MPAVPLHDSYKYIILFHQLFKLSHGITEPRRLISQTSSSFTRDNKKDFATEYIQYKGEEFTVLCEFLML